MSVIGTLHEFSFYGLLTTLFCLVQEKISIEILWNSAFHPEGFLEVFYAYLFWASVLFIPIALIGALYTKFVDDGEGLTFDSENLIIIFFGHIIEEILGLVLTPIWFIKYIITDDLDFWRVVDTLVYVVLLIFIGIGLVMIL